MAHFEKLLFRRGGNIEAPTQQIGQTYNILKQFAGNIRRIV